MYLLLNINGHEKSASKSKFAAMRMNTSLILNVMGWLLVAGAVAVLGGSFFVGASFYEALKNAVPTGVLLALSGHLFTQAKTITEAAEKRSLFNLEGFRKAFNHAQELLSDGNNDRAKWIEAARSLAHGAELAKAVSVDAHQRVLELERLKYRGFFHQILSSNTAEFFYGVPASYPNLDEAAKASSAPEMKNGRHQVSTLKELGEASIYLVWSAAQWPKDYDDPMHERFGADQEGNLLLLYPELQRFLDHKRSWATAAGSLYTRAQE